MHMYILESLTHRAMSHPASCFTPTINPSTKSDCFQFCGPVPPQELIHRRRPHPTTEPI